MKVLQKAGALFLLLPALLACGRAGAQNFGMSISNSPSQVVVGDTLTYTILVTNATAASGVVVTDYLPATVQFVSATNSVVAVVSNNAGIVAFTFGGTFQFATLTLTVIPTNFGLLTNTATVGILGVGTSLEASNLVFVSNPQTSLGLTMTGPSAAVVANDWMTYSLTVSNTGSNTANNVIVSNTLPPGVGLTPNTPTSPSFTFSNSVMVFNLGNLSVGAAQTLSFVVQPTNSGATTNVTLTFSASAVASHATNTFASTNITILPLITNELVAFNLSSNMTYDAQNGLMEQTIVLSNTGPTNVDAARVIVSGLSNNVTLYNSIGINNGNPFVEYGTNLNAGQSVNLLMQYYVPTRQSIPIPNSNYTAVPVTAPDLSPPAGTPIPVTLTNLAHGLMLIEFQSIPGRTYTVVYSDDITMSNALAAQPSIVAPADRTQWRDFGPPITISAPTNAMRFYSVLLNP